MGAKQREESAWKGYRSSLIYGAVSAVILFALLLGSAIVGGTHPILYEKASVVSKACLVASALICGFFASGVSKRDRLAHAMAGEGMLLLFLLLSKVCFGVGSGWVALGIDFGIMFFGGFAGTLLRSGIGTRRRRKR